MTDTEFTVRDAGHGRTFIVRHTPGNEPDVWLLEEPEEVVELSDKLALYVDSN